MSLLRRLGRGFGLTAVDAKVIADRAQEKISKDVNAGWRQKDMDHLIDAVLENVHDSAKEGYYSRSVHILEIHEIVKRNEIQYFLEAEKTFKKIMRDKGFKVSCQQIGYEIVISWEKNSGIS